MTTDNKQTLDEFTEYLIERETLLTDWLDAGPNKIADIVALVEQDRGLLKKLRFDRIMKTAIDPEAMPTTRQDYPAGLADCGDAWIDDRGQWQSKPITQHRVATLDDLRSRGGPVAELLASTAAEVLGDQMPRKQDEPVLVFPRQSQQSIGDVISYTKKAIEELDREAERIASRKNS